LLEFQLSFNLTARNVERKLMRALADKITRFFYQGLEKKFLLLNALFAFLLFIFFPLLIFFKGAGMLIERQIIRTNIIQQSKAEALLDQMTAYTNNDIFAHRLLFSVCHDSNNAKRRLKELTPLLKRVKTLYPETFTFIVADKSGKLLEEFSDETRFSYLYRQAFSFLFEFEQAKPSIQNEDTETRLKRLRNLLGDLMRPQDIYKPLLAKDHGQSILVSGSKKKFHLWYGSGMDFKIIVFISRDFIKGTAGLDWFVTNTNQRNKDFITGYTEYPPKEHQLQRFLSEQHIPDTIRAIAESESIKFSDRNSLNQEKITCRFLNQHMRGFTFQKKLEKVSPGKISARIAADIFKAIFILLFILYVYQKLNPISLTIKLKISAFFAYSILLPLLIIASISGDYFAQQREELTETLGRQVVQFCKNLETGFNFYLQQTAAKIEKFVSHDYANNDSFAANRSWSRQFNEKISLIADHEELLVINSDAKDLMLGFSPRLTTNTMVLKQFTSEAMRLLLDKELEKINKSITNQYFAAINVHYGQSKIRYAGIGEYDLYSYAQFLTNNERELDKSFAVYALWKKSSFHERFILQSLKNNNFEQEDAITAFYNIESRSIILSNSDKSMNAELLNFFRQSEGNQYSINKSLKLGNKEYIAVAISGQQLDKILIALLYPVEILEKQINQKITYAAYAGLLMMLFASSGAWLLSGWIFKPLDTLKAGIKTIAAHDFNYKLEVVCNNEMGRLIKAFNNSIETLQDLEVARVVQESMLSQNSLRKNRIEVTARSNVMTRLGGDYYDMVECSDEKILVFIGDATGHGIPAAMSMAMAKSVMLHESLEETDQTRLMTKLHMLFSRLRSQGVKDFMTATSVLLDSQKGEVTFMNAGHCYPILLKKDDTSGRLLSEIKGLPPGFSRSLKLLPVTMQLEPNDILILFTDGLVESCNSSGELFGFDGLQKIVAETRNNDLKLHLDSILAAVQSWEIEATDDQTVILVRYS